MGSNGPWQGLPLRKNVSNVFEYSQCSRAGTPASCRQVFEMALKTKFDRDLVQFRYGFV